MANQILHHDRKHFCRNCLQSFSTTQILGRHVSEVNGEQIIKIGKKVETVKFKNYTKKLKLSFMIYANFVSFLITENNGRLVKMSLIPINIKIMLVLLMVTNYCVLMTSIASLLSHTCHFMLGPGYCSQVYH